MALSAARRLLLCPALALVVWAVLLAGGAQSASAEGVVEAVIGRATGTLSHVTGAVLSSQPQAPAASSEGAPQQGRQPGQDGVAEAASVEAEGAVGGSGLQTRTGHSAPAEHGGADGTGRTRTPQPAPARRGGPSVVGQDGPGRRRAAAGEPAGGNPMGRTPEPLRHLLATGAVPVARAVLEAGKGASGVGAATLGAGHGVTQGVANSVLEMSAGLLGRAVGGLDRAGSVLEGAGGLVEAVLEEVGSAGVGPTSALAEGSSAGGSSAGLASVPGATSTAAQPIGSGLRADTAAADVGHAQHSFVVRGHAASAGGPPSASAMNAVADEVAARSSGMRAYRLAQAPVVPSAPGSGSVPSAAGAAAAGAAGAAVALLALIGLAPPGSRRRPRERDHAGLADPFALLLCRPG